MRSKKPATTNPDPQPGKAVTNPENAKTNLLSDHTVNDLDQDMTTNHGVKINDDQNSLKAGERGPSLLEDFIMREKITHFDHERIPERIVHARGAGAHGVFKLYKSQSALTSAAFLNDTEIETPVFVRFSTVAGSRGSTDLARDVRGFAVKFYTQEGNFDLVGNNMPVFFIQDAMKFPDLIHSVKPEPDNEIPQAASAHDTFWDFISLSPESAHMIMWAMSDRAIPRSLRMMEGFGVHTFRLVNSKGEAQFVKFHWKPILGVHSVAWSEAQEISGKDPDFHRRDLWNAIETGNYPEWELGIQVIPEADEHKYDFDLLDATKLVPEELVPVQRIGKMTLNRNPDNYFAETEQVAFHVGHIVPGIDFTNDPLMQGRLFSYTDTQLIRLGGPNFHEIPINRPVVPVHNNQRDGYMRQTINKGKTHYGPNTLTGNSPHQVKQADGGFVSYQERVEAYKVRGRSRSFADHFSQAKLFYHSMSEPEQQHIIDALSFELGHVQSIDIRLRMLRILSHIDKELVTAVAKALRLDIPKDDNEPLNMAVPADADMSHYESIIREPSIDKSPTLSMANTVKDSIATRQIAILAADGVDEDTLMEMKQLLMDKGAVVEVVAPFQGYVMSDKQKQVPVDKSLLTAASVFYDAVYVAGGKAAVEALKTEPEGVHFLNEAYKHCKAIAVAKQAFPVLQATYFGSTLTDETKLPEGVFAGDDIQKLGASFVEAVAKHRFWEREMSRKVPA